MGKKKLQIVWPKDGDKGRDRRGWKGRLGDVLTGKGPDMFLQEGGKKGAIPPDWWGNWDSYHHSQPAYDENYGPSIRSRSLERYDPYTRKYVKWGQPTDWSNSGVNYNGASQRLKIYPRYTEKERKRMYSPRMRQGWRPDPEKMGSEWSSIGPKRFRPEHDWFWRSAHRIGNNAREGFSVNAPINPMFTYHQTNKSELGLWTNSEFWHWLP